MDKRFQFISSVALRTGLFSTLWVSVVLVILVMISAFFYRDANERNFERLLNAHLYSLIGAVSLSEAGMLQGVPELGDIRYNDPDSGWYWEVFLLDAGEGSALKSPSLLGKNIAGPDEEALAFDAHFRRSYHAKGLQAEDIVIVESDIVIAAQNQPLSQGVVARFRIMGNEAELHNRLDEFWATMRWYLLGFILLSSIINALMIVVGMRPLRKIKRALSAVREGEASHIDVDLPLEIQPMIREMNALIDNQRHQTKHFRDQLGNLAHAMKTPLAVILNETARQGSDHKDRLILEQAKLMQSQIQHHLQRAQRAAQRGILTARTDIMPVIERLVRVMGKLFPDKQFRIEGGANGVIFAGEAQDLEEMIGNLLENAGKWARSTIVITLQKNKETAQNTASWQLVIEDDGAGLSEDKRHQALQRGRRLDESVPGTGLGLSIVTNLVAECGGTFQLGDSALGGLRATITLPLERVS